MAAGLDPGTGPGCAARRRRQLGGSGRYADGTLQPAAQQGGPGNQTILNARMQEILSYLIVPKAAQKYAFMWKVPLRQNAA